MRLLHRAQGYCTLFVPSVHGVKRGVWKGQFRLKHLALPSQSTRHLLIMSYELLDRGIEIRCTDHFGGAMLLERDLEVIHTHNTDTI